MVVKTTGFILAALALCLPAPAAQTADKEPGVLALESKPAPDVTLDQLLNPDHAAWVGSPKSPLQFNRTPPVYATDPKDDGTRPEASVQLLRHGNDVVLRAHWTDPTDNQMAPGKRFPDAGEKHIYKLHSQETNVFPDAMCVMVPQERGPQVIYPSVMMGEGTKPVDLFYWKAGVGFELLNAHGRTSTASTRKPVQGNARRDSDGWTVTIVIPNLTVQTPVCFAIWDGAKEQRDGLKYFSLWYEVE